MFGIDAKASVSAKPVIDATQKAAFKNFAHALARIRKDEAESIVKSTEPSQPGQPPHTRGRGRKSLKRAFRFFYDKEEMSGIVGPVASAVGEVGRAHEFGGEYKGEYFEKREFARPALLKNIPRFAQEWRGSI